MIILFNCFQLLFKYFSIRFWIIFSIIFQIFLNYIFICLTYYFFQEVLSIRTIFLLPSIWISVEFLRSFFALAFPWISIGNTQAYNYMISQNAELFGIYGISFWIILINVLFFQLLKLRNRRNALILFIIFQLRREKQLISIPLVHWIIKWCLLKVHNIKLP